MIETYNQEQTRLSMNHINLEKEQDGNSYTEQNVIDIKANKHLKFKNTPKLIECRGKVGDMSDSAALLEGVVDANNVELSTAEA